LTNFYLYGIITGVQVLQKLSYYLSLRGIVFFPHGAIYEFHYVSVKVSDKVLKILAMSFRIQTLSPYPFHRVPA